MSDASLTLSAGESISIHEGGSAYSSCSAFVWFDGDVFGVAVGVDGSDLIQIETSGGKITSVKRLDGTQPAKKL